MYLTLKSPNNSNYLNVKVNKCLFTYNIHGIIDSIVIAQDKTCSGITTQYFSQYYTITDDNNKQYKVSEIRARIPSEFFKYAIDLNCVKTIDKNGEFIT